MRKVGKNFTYVLVFAGDIIVISDNQEAIRTLKSRIPTNFLLEGKGELKWFVGMRVHKQLSLVNAEHEILIETLVKFSRENCKPLRTSAMVFAKLSKGNETGECVDVMVFRSVVFSHVFLAKQLRPGIK